MNGTAGETTPQPATSSFGLSGEIHANVRKVAVALGNVEAVAHDEFRLDMEADISEL
jgi:hypothetical protein